MTYYNFKQGIFLVRGHVNGCIYDTNNLNLYAITGPVVNGLVELVKNHKIVDDNLNWSLIN